VKGNLTHSKWRIQWRKAVSKRALLVEKSIIFINGYLLANAKAIEPFFSGNHWQRAK